jgi:hypothetical protein
MIECGSLEFAQARIGARHGERVRESDWHAIETVRELGPVLELARATSLRPWLAGIDAASDAHRIESALRERWRAVVAEVAGWMPKRWRPALAWWATVPDLAPLQHLARGEEPAAWMRDDVVWQALAAAAPGARAMLPADGALAALSPAWFDPEALPRLWAAEWRRRWPDRRREEGEKLEPLARAWFAHLRRLAAATSGESWMLRTALRAELVLLLRRATLEPAAAFIHLLLCAIDLERLRAELLRRVVFGRWKAP